MIRLTYNRSFTLWQPYFYYGVTPTGGAACDLADALLAWPDEHRWRGQVIYSPEVHRHAVFYAHCQYRGTF